MARVISFQPWCDLARRLWEKAAAAAVAVAAKSLQDLRIAEIAHFDIHLGEHGKVVAYRAKVEVSFKFRADD
ncbi:MAG: dodecin domain-containing protein [Acidimicrobiia bacterium]